MLLLSNDDSISGSIDRAVVSSILYLRAKRKINLLLLEISWRIHILTHFDCTQTRSRKQIRPQSSMCCVPHSRMPASRGLNL